MHEICEYLNVGTVELCDIVRINEVLFRAKILNRESKLKLLSEVKKLKNSERYSSIYIQKDLTYEQRRVLLEKRRKRESVGNTTNGSHLNIISSQFSNVENVASRTSELVSSVASNMEVNVAQGSNSRGRAAVRGTRARGRPRVRGHRVGGRGRSSELTTPSQDVAGVQRSGDVVGDVVPRPPTGVRHLRHNNLN